jgi:ABC-type transport system involved in multi-copper enzyme maturation permease subunit
MNVFLTLLLDSLRLLRARVLFWITLIISALIAVIYLSIGFTPEGISLLFGAINIKIQMLSSGSGMAEIFYLSLFSNYLVGFWLSFFAVILAIISCAPIFPDFMSEGSIGIPLSKPVSRLKLFFFKYIGSLLFVVLQVGIFCVIVFFAIRLRIGSWNPSVFWAVPIVTLMFSYIYSVVVLVSVMTRSVLVAILAGLVVWFIAFAVQKTDDAFYLAAHPSSVMPGMDGMLGSSSESQKWQKISSMVLTPLPKTSGTTGLLDRLIHVTNPKDGADTSLNSAATDDAASGHQNQMATRDSISYVIGTSLLFEMLMLGWAAAIFCRRDY